MNEELKACPFCGSPGQMKEDDLDPEPHAECSNYVDCGTYAGNAELSAKWWNTRPIEAALTAELETAAAYVTALVEALSAEQFCALVEAGKVDGIRAWMEVRR